MERILEPLLAAKPDHLHLVKIKAPQELHSLQIYLPPKEGHTRDALVANQKKLMMAVRETIWQSLNAKDAKALSAHLNVFTVGPHTRSPINYDPPQYIEIKSKTAEGNRLIEEIAGRLRESGVTQVQDHLEGWKRIEKSLKPRAAEKPAKRKPILPNLFRTRAPKK